MNILRKALLTAIACIGIEYAFAQQVQQFSLLTDVSFLRSIRHDQRYWAIGQNVSGNFNFTPKQGIYTTFCYYSTGKFTNNDLTALAKSAATVPQSIGYSNRAAMDIRHLSIGWRQYLVGDANQEKHFNLYLQVGLGLMFGKVANTQSATIDSALYTMPVQGGEASFKRLTYDGLLGIERHIGGQVYAYLDGRILIPSTDYPYDHLLINHNAPLLGTLNLGLRILFE